VEVLREKPAPAPLYPPHVSHGLTQDQTWASMVTGRKSPPESCNRLSEAQQMLLDKYLNTQFVPHRKHSNLNYKDHILNVAYKTNHCLFSIIWSAQTQCVCKMYKFLISQLVVCIICNYCALKGQMFFCIVLQYVTVLIDTGIHQLTA